MEKLSLYQFQGCPYCEDVTDFTEQQDIKLDIRDTRKNDVYEQELIQGGGKPQVPCLKIENDEGNVQWMYESQEIIRFLSSHHGVQRAFRHRSGNKPSWSD